MCLFALKHFSVCLTHTGDGRRREAASRSQGRVGVGSHMAVAGHRSFSPDSAPADQRILLDRGFGAGVIGRSGVGAGSGGNAHVLSAAVGGGGRESEAIMVRALGKEQVESCWAVRVEVRMQLV